MTRLLVQALLLLLCLALVRAVRAEPPVREPSVREVVAMARRAAGRLGPERTRELCKRARLSGLVPSLRLSARRGLSQDSSSTSSVTSDRTNASLGDDLTLEATLSFDLPRLVFASEEVRLLSVERWLVNDLRKFLEDVTRLYFQRRRLLAERAAAIAPDAELDTQLEELEALLDAFTDGAFLAALPPRPARPAPPALRHGAGAAAPDAPSTSSATGAPGQASAASEAERGPPAEPARAP